MSFFSFFLFEGYTGKKCMLSLIFVITTVIIIHSLIIDPTDPPRFGWLAPTHPKYNNKHRTPTILHSSIHSSIHPIQVQRSRQKDGSKKRKHKAAAAIASCRSTFSDRTSPPAPSFLSSFFFFFCCCRC